MSNGIVLAGKFSEALLNKNIKVWVGRGMTKTATEMPYYKEIAMNTPTNEEMFTLLDGVERGEFMEIPEDGKPHEETDLPGFKTTFVVKDFGLIKSISKIAGRADATSHRQKTEQRLASSIGQAYIQKLNRDVADVLLNGFDTSFTSYGDGKPFFSTSHTRIDGGSTTYRSNASSIGLTLGYDNLKTLRLQIRRVVDGAGRNIDYTHKALQLIVPPALEDTAYEAIGTPKHLFKTTSADFTPNALQSNGVVGIKVNPMLGAEAIGSGSDTAWYLHVDGLGDDEPIQVYHRQGMVLESEKDFDTGRYRTKGTAAYAIGWNDPMGKWLGTKGDGAAYSS